MHPKGHPRKKQIKTLGRAQRPVGVLQKYGVSHITPEDIEDAAKGREVSGKKDRAH